MRKRVLMSSVAATVVASMMMFTGCGSSSSDSSTPAASASAPVETKSVPSVIDQSAVATAAAKAAEAAIAAAKAEEARYKLLGDKERMECNGGVEAFTSNGVTKCPSVESNAAFISDPDFFRSIMGSMYEAMNIPFAAYDAAIIAALKTTTMTEFVAALTTFKYNDMVADVANIEFGAAPWRVSLVETAVQSLTSNASSDAKAVVLAAIDGYIKMGAKGLADDDQNSSGMVPASYAANSADAARFMNDFSVTRLFAIEKFILTYKDMNGGIDTRALAIKLITGEYYFNNDNKMYHLVAGVEQEATGKPVSRCVTTDLIECGPRVALFTADGTISGDDDNKSQYSFTNIDSICESAFSKYDVDGNDIKAGMPIEVALFTNEQKYVRLDEAGKLSSLNKQFTAVETYLTNALSIELAPAIDEGMRGLDENYTTTIVLDFPDACTNGDATKQEYLTLSFMSNFKVDANGDWNLSMIDNPASTDQDVLVTGRTYNATTDSYDVFNLATKLDATKDFIVSANGAATINPVKLLSEIIELDNGTGVTHDVYLPKVKELLVRKFTNEGTFISKLSMVKDFNDTAVLAIDSNISAIADINAKANNQITAADTANLVTYNTNIANLRKVVGGANFISNTGILIPSAYGLDKKANTMVMDDNFRALNGQSINAVVVKTCLN